MTTRTTRRVGRIRQWHDKKGFGYIQSHDKTSLFFHISQFQSSVRPRIDDEVTFISDTDKRGRKIANQVKPVVKAQTRHREKVGAPSVKQKTFVANQRKVLLLGIICYTLLALLPIASDTNWFIFYWYLLLGVITFFVYAKDKSAAQSGSWRTSEVTLHILSLFGGWVGAMIAQTYLRHKSRKKGFRVVFFMTAIINVLILISILLGLHKPFLLTLKSLM